MAQVIKNRFWKIILWALSVSIGLLIILLLLLQSPKVQTYLINRISQRFLQETGFSLSIASVSIKWFDEMQFNQVLMIDPEGNRMVEAKNIQIDLNLINLISQDNIEEDMITLDSANLFLTHNQYNDSSSMLNISLLISKFRGNETDMTKSTKSILVHNLYINNSSIAFDNKYMEPLEAGLDVNHLIFSNLTAHLNEFSIVGGTIMATIVELHALEKNIDLPISDLTANFLMDSSRINLSQLNLKLGKSTIQDSLDIHFYTVDNLKYFRDSVDLSINFKSSVIYSSDLLKILPATQYVPDQINITGNFHGKLSGFQLDNLALRFGESTLNGSIGLYGLPDINETFINVQLIKSTLEAQDLQGILGINEDLVGNLGRMRVTGRFLGYPRDFVAFGEFQNKFGTITSDINLKLPVGKEPSYKGNLSLTNFEAGKFLGDPTLGKINFKGSIVGNSFDIKTIQMDMRGDFKLLEFNNYPYRNIYADGRIANNFYKGYMRINDPNLKFEMDGTLDLTKGKEKISVVSILDHINLKPLGLSEEDIVARASANGNFSGITLDDFTGKLQLKEFEIQVNSQQLLLDTITLISEMKEDSSRHLEARSDLANISINGNFRLENTYYSLIEVLAFYRDIIVQNPVDSTLKTIPTEEFLDFDLEIIDLNPLLHLWNTDAYISKNTSFTGDFRSGKSSILNIYSIIDTLIYENNTLLDNIVELNATRSNETLESLAMLYLESKNQDFSGVLSQDIFLEFILDQGHLDFELNGRQSKYENALNLNGNVDFESSYTKIGIESANLELLSKPWKIDTSGELIFSENSLEISDIIISNEYQGLAVDGAISRKPEDMLTIEFESLGLENINSLINKELSGYLSGYMNISNFYENTRIENDLNVLDFSINNFPVGDVFGKVLWDKELRQFDLDFNVMSGSSPVMDLKGYLNPSAEESLFINAALTNAPINILEPFIDKYFSNIEGKASGNFQIKGNPLSPRVFGRASLVGGKMNVNYLMTEYNLFGEFSFSEDIIYLDNINVRDRFGNTGKFKGSINHGGFRNMSVDLVGEFNRIQLLNTSSSQNNLFYGQGFGSGNISFKGPVTNMSIVANATTEKGTRIFIPIGGLENIDTRDFINFISFSDTLSTDKQSQESYDINGLTLDLNINVTNDAYCEIIFDIKAGDIIRGRGKGDLNLRIDTNGEFNMFGPLVIDEGWYNFTLYNLINKEFIINPGGRITWYGDPYEGIMDLTASYKQPASLSPLLNTDYSETSDIKRPYPTEVLMNLKGPLLSPEIDFDILANQLPKNVLITSGDATGTSVDLELEFQSFMNRIDEQELKRQVFSLIVLKKFSPLEAFNTGGVIQNSVSELFSNQLSYWMSQVDDNLEIDFDVDLTSLDQEAFNTFQMRLSYSFFNGRLRLTRDGAFVNQNDEVDPNSLVGNWSVEYLITPDGRVRARVYNKNNYDNLNIQQGNVNTKGISLQYTQSFNEFFAEIGRIFKSSEKEKEPQPLPPAPESGILNNEEYD